MSGNPNIPLIPLPASVKTGAYTFPLDDNIHIILPDGLDQGWLAASELFASKIARRHGVKLPVVTGAEDISGAIMVEQKSPVPGIPDTEFQQKEGYIIVIGKSVRIQVSTSHGLHNALMSLLQLIKGKSLPAAKIVDFPRFRHRGMMLDSARSFLPPDVIKRYIDILSELKLNVFHWHIVDDQGWRVESKIFPKLHEVGGIVSNLSKKKLKALATVQFDEHGNRMSEPRYSTIEEASNSRGYYTQDELKEIVEYAFKRHVSIIPEIDVPGHTSALLAAYPELSCTGKPVKVRSLPGISKTALCPGKEEVYDFLDKLFGELKEIFPSDYVHIGGDEVQDKTWMESPANRKLIEEHGITDKAGLQSYFTGRVSEILKNHGKTMIAWDEVTRYAPEGSVIQAWRRHKFSRKAAEAGLDSVVSPVSCCYLDYPQLVFTPKKLYSFEPIPEGLDKSLHHHIIGGEVNLWSEFVTLANIDSKAFPRVIAHSEVMWSPPELRNWEGFLGRLAPLKKGMEARGIQFGKAWQDIF